MPRSCAFQVMRHFRKAITQPYFFLVSARKTSTFANLSQRIHSYLKYRILHRGCFIVTLSETRIFSGPKLRCSQTNWAMGTNVQPAAHLHSSCYTMRHVYKWCLSSRPPLTLASTFLSCNVQGVLSEFRPANLYTALLDI